MHALAKIAFTPEQQRQLEPVLQALAEAGDGAATLAQLCAPNYYGSLMLSVGVVSREQALAVQAIVAPELVGESVSIYVPPMKEEDNAK